MASTTASPDRAHNHSQGIILRCGAVVCFALMSAALKRVSEAGVGPVEMLFYRAVFGLPIVLGWVLVDSGLDSLKTRRPLAHIGRSVIGISSVLMTFQALTMLPLADATTIGFTSPIFATILSMLLFGEKVGSHRLLAILVGFAGVAVVTSPGSASHALPHAGVIVALVAAAGTAGVTITLRQLSATEHVGAIVFWFFVATAIVTGIGMIFVGQSHDPFTWTLLATAGITGGVAQIMMTSSLRVAPVSVVAPFDYLQIVGAIALGWMIWSSTPSANMLMGALLIGGSGLYTAYREHRLRRRELAVASTPPMA